jgi:hypothetical protein
MTGPKVGKVHWNTVSGVALARAPGTIVGTWCFPVFRYRAVVRISGSCGTSKQGEMHLRDEAC